MFRVRSKEVIVDFDHIKAASLCYYIKRLMMETEESLDELRGRFVSLQKALDDQMGLQRLLVVALGEARANVSSIDQELKALSAERSAAVNRLKQIDRGAEATIRKAREELEDLQRARKERETTMELAETELDYGGISHKEEQVELEQERLAIESRIAANEAMMNELGKTISSDVLMIDVWRSRVEEISRVLQSKQRSRNGGRSSLPRTPGPSKGGNRKAKPRKEDVVVETCKPVNLFKFAHVAYSSVYLAPRRSEEVDEEVDEAFAEDVADAMETREDDESSTTTTMDGDLAGATISLSSTASITKKSTNKGTAKKEDHDDENISNDSTSYTDVKCSACADPSEDEPILLCDGCDLGFHLHCVRLDSVPEGDWFCPGCSTSSSSSSVAVTSSATTFTTSSTPHASPTASTAPAKSLRKNPEGNNRRQSQSDKDPSSSSGGKKKPKTSPN